MKLNSQASGPAISAAALWLRRERSTLLLLVAIFAYFSLWALVKPPFQSPDEFAHYTKAMSLLDEGAFAPDRIVHAPQERLNPLATFQRLHLVPFHPERVIGARDLIEMRALKWPSVSEPRRAEAFSTAHQYPPLFYAIALVGGEFFSRLLGLSPYASHYAWRIWIAFVASFLWLWLFVELKRSDLAPWRNLVLVFLLANPTFAFTATAINPDAFFIPLTLIAMLRAWRVIFDEENPLPAFLVLTSCCLIKQAAYLTLGAIFAVAGITWLMRLRKRPLIASSRDAARLFAITFLPGIIAWLLYFAWAPIDGTPVAAPRPELLDYLGQLWQRSTEFFNMAWGVLGWLDYRLPQIYFRIARYLLWINAALFVVYLTQREKKFRTWPTIALLLSSLLYCAAVCALEYLLYPQAGPIIQGRYFFPAALGFALVLCHRSRWLARGLVLFAIVCNVVMFDRTVERYYQGNWRRYCRALPFVDLQRNSHGRHPQRARSD